MKKSYSFLILIIVFLSTNSIFSQSDKTNEQLISEFIQKKREFNKEFGHGYRIQLFYGDEITAKKLREKFKLDFKDVKTYLLYEKPSWKIQIGHYKTRLEADRAIVDLKKRFRDAIVVPLGK